MRTIRELGALLRTRHVSSLELVQEFYSQLRNESFGSLITETEDLARKEAIGLDDELGRGIDRGPLHGIPQAPKDLFYTKGIRTTGGSLVYSDFFPSYDATVIRRLREAGTVLVGKTNLHEIAYGISSLNPHFGPVINPRDRSRLAGGSSGGSAALVAAGLLPMCLGTDTGGSVRIPASYCGVVGLKPTYGRVSRFGVLPLSYSLDHVGVLAASVDDCALTYRVIAGGDSNDPTCSPRPIEEISEAAPSWQNIRVGIPQDFFFNAIDAQVELRVRDAIERLRQAGVQIVTQTLPDMSEINAAARVVQFAEASAIYAHITDPSLFSQSAWSLLQQGRLIAGHEYVNAQRLRSVFRRQFDAVWRDIDLLVAPTTPVTAPPSDHQTVQIGTFQEDVRMASTRLLRSFNYLGEPSISLPCGSDSRGLPVGLQLIAPPFHDWKLLQIARQVEQLLS